MRQNECRGLLLISMAFTDPAMILLYASRDLQVDRAADAYQR